MRDLANNRLQRLYEYKEKTLDSVEEEKDTTDAKINNNWLVARNPYTGKQEKLVPSRRSVDELMLASHVHKNKQYQWLLAESYEIFKDTL